MAKPTTESAASAELELRPAEQEILAQEIAAFAETLKDPELRERYRQLDAAARQGLVPPELVGVLGAMLELLLQTQRIRRRHGPSAEQTLAELFYRTPRGAGLRQAAREVNRSLEVLRGQTLEKLSIVSSPGRHTIVIDTDRCRLTLKLDGAGARVENVEVGA